MVEESEAYAKIQRIGRWTYRVLIYGSRTVYIGNWVVWGRNRAERVARRKLQQCLRRWQQRADWSSDERTIRP